MNLFDQKLLKLKLDLTRKDIEVLQINLGKMCNIACHHCHVEAGPTKSKENLGKEVFLKIIKMMDQFSIQSIDLTGGAPEMNPYFKDLVQEARIRDIHTINRSNLIIFFETGFEDIPQFLANHQIEIMASLPCYLKENVDQQRGSGVFQKSIKALQLLNQLGYGLLEPLKLNLVYNPVGTYLPPDQNQLEADYRKILMDEYGVQFNRLITITNMPITRYQKYLKAKNQYDDYIDLLENHFNSETIDYLMCRHTMSISWDGHVYDCDFNQALKLPVRNIQLGSLTIDHLLSNADIWKKSKIQTASHCFACTAGSGSSCQGALKP